MSIHGNLAGRKNTDKVPEGFLLHFRKSPLTEPWEPLYSKVRAGTLVVGVHLRPAHCNSRGLAHGGFLSALADNAMGLAAAEARWQQTGQRPAPGLTVSLALDFLGSAKIGQWVEFVPRVLKVGGSLSFVDCLILADGQGIARGNAVYRAGRSPDATTAQSAEFRGTAKGLP